MSNKKASQTDTSQPLVEREIPDDLMNIAEPDAEFLIASEKEGRVPTPVSYTHLTLPTIYSV